MRLYNTPLLLTYCVSLVFRIKLLKQQLQALSSNVYFSQSESACLQISCASENCFFQLSTWQHTPTLTLNISRSLSLFLCVLSGSAWRVGKILCLLQVPAHWSGQVTWPQRVVVGCRPVQNEKVSTNPKCYKKDSCTSVQGKQATFQEVSSLVTLYLGTAEQHWTPFVHLGVPQSHIERYSK